MVFSRHTRRATQSPANTKPPTSQERDHTHGPSNCAGLFAKRLDGNRSVHRRRNWARPLQARIWRRSLFLLIVTRSLVILAHNSATDLARRVLSKCGRVKYKSLLCPTCICQVQEPSVPNIVPPVCATSRACKPNLVPSWCLITRTVAQHLPNESVGGLRHSSSAIGFATASVCERLAPTSAVSHVVASQYVASSAAASSGDASWGADIRCNLRCKLRPNPLS